jgi:hypothetical protein
MPQNDEGLELALTQIPVFRHRCRPHLGWHTNQRVATRCRISDPWLSDATNWAHHTKRIEFGHAIPWASSLMRIPLHAGTKGASHPCCSRCHRTSNPMRPPASNPRWSFCVTNQKQDRRRRRYHLERNTASITKMKPTTVRTSTGLGKSRER